MEEENELTEEEAKSRLGMILLTLLILAIIFPVLLISYCLRRKIGFINRIFEGLFYGLFFNQTARFVLESYTPLMQTQIENLNRGLNFSTWVHSILSVNDLVFTIAYGLFPLAVTYYFYTRLRYFKKKWFLRKWGEVMSNLSWRRKSSSFFIAIFCYRRLFAAILVVVCADAQWAQVTLSVYINQMVVTGVGLSSPFKYRGERLLELFNEVNIMLCSYHLFLFTDFVPDPEVRSQIGVSMICFTSFNFVFNIGIMLFSTIREALRAYRMKVGKYKK